MRPGKLQTITFLAHQGASFVLRLRQSFPEDCVRLKLSSTRASQAGLKEMMTQTKSEGLLSSRARGDHLYCSHQLKLYAEGNYRLCCETRGRIMEERAMI